MLLTSDGHIKIADFGSVKPMVDSRITVLPNAASGSYHCQKKKKTESCSSTFWLGLHPFFHVDDKACTFVGTAAYVPPEVLNSSPATFG